mgnify:CR=1 FL=1
MKNATNTRHGVVFLPSYIEGIRELTDDPVIRCEFYEAIFDYAQTHTIPIFKNKIAKAGFQFIVDSLDATLRRYDASIKNGKKGGRPKKINPDSVSDAPKKPAKAVAIVDKLNWDCVPGVQLTLEQQEKAIEIRKKNNDKKAQKFTQSSLTTFLRESSKSLNAGISINEVLTAWEDKVWKAWTHRYYANELAQEEQFEKKNASDPSASHLSFAQSDKIDKGFQDIKSTLEFCYSTYIDPLCPADKKGEWNSKTIRSTVQEHLKDLQLSDNQQSMLLRKLQAWIIVEHKDLAQEMNFNIPIGAQLKIGGAGNE